MSTKVNNYLEFIQEGQNDHSIHYKDVMPLLKGSIPFARKPSMWSDIMNHKVMIEDLPLDTLLALEKIPVYTIEDIIDIDKAVKVYAYLESNPNSRYNNSMVEEYWKQINLSPTEIEETKKAMLHNTETTWQYLFMATLKRLKPIYHPSEDTEYTWYIFILEVDSKYYIIDTQGFDYIRYICEIKHFDELKWIIYDKKKETKGEN